MAEESKAPAAEAAGEGKKNPNQKGQKKPAYGDDAKKAVKHPWTEERCMRAARRFASEDQWKSGSPSSYKAAISRGWREKRLFVLAKGGVATAKKPEGKSRPVKKSA